MRMHSFSTRWSGSALLVAAFLCLASAAVAQEDPPAVPEAAQANNPLANFTAFNVHYYYIGELTTLDEEVDGESAHQAWVRFAKPFSIGETNWIMRASLPINKFPVPPELDKKTGLGDLNLFAAYLIDTGNPAVATGFGPQITMPTATNSALGSEKWSAGLVHTLFDMRSKKFQYGYLMSWQASFAGEEDRNAVNTGAFQPFGFYQLGRGTHLRSSAVMVYDFESGNYTVPVGLGIGQVIPTEKAVFNLFFEPQVSLVDKGAGWPAWQLFIALNTQIK